MYFFLKPRDLSTSGKPETEKPYWQKRLLDYNQKILESPANAAYFYQCKAGIESSLGEIDSAYNAQAYEDYTKAINLDPRRHDAYCFRGEFSAKLGHYKEALSDYEAAMKTCSHVSRAGCNRARLLGELGKYKEANKAWSDIIAKPDAAHLFLERAHLRFIYKHYQLALDDCEKMLQSRHFFSPAYTYLQRAFINCALGNYYKAAENCDKTVQADPSNPQGYALQNLVYRMLALEGKPLGAEEKSKYIALKQFMQTNYELALENCCKSTNDIHNSEEIDLVQLQADMYSVLRKNAKAKEFYQIVVQEKPKDYAAFRQFTLTEHDLHESMQALEQAKKLLATDPSNSDLITLVNLLTPPHRLRYD